MTTSSSVFRKAVSAVASLSLVLSSFAILIVPAQAAAPNWDTSGSYVADFNYLGTDYAHDISLTQDGGGNLTGNGGSPAGANTYEWTITSGSVDGDTIEFEANYTATADAVVPQTTMHVEGTIAPDGSMSGTWSDNYQGGSREGTWQTTSGEASEVSNPSVTTDAATGISESDATLNGTNGADDAVGHSFWVSTTTFSTASPSIPSEVYSTPDMGPIAADTPFSATLSSITSNGVPTNLPPITPGTTYYYAAWSLVDGTWYPGEILTVTTDEAPEEPGTNTVTIVKYIDGVAASTTNASASFPMSSTWTATNLNGGAETSGTYPLGPVGYNSTNPYEAITSDMDSGSSYTTTEDLSGDTVGASCEDGKPYALSGYTWGNSIEQAEAGEPSMTAPDFENIINNKYVIVWNETCDDEEPAPGPEFVKVVVSKFIDGQMATSGNASSSFPMVSSTTASNVNGGQPSGPNAYTLDLTNGYDATTTDMASGAYYSTNEVLSGPLVGATCEEGKQYALSGYSSGNTLAGAASAATSTAIPTFNNLQSDKYVIVWNKTCGTTSTPTTTDAALHVDSIDAQKTNGSANNTYEDGWRYVFRITAPTSEENLSMRFSDWVGANASNTIPVANNMRVSSAQASNPGPVTLTAANSYSTPAFVMVSDLDPVAPGRQVDVVVELKIPVGTANDSYTTTYGVQTLP